MDAQELLNIIKKSLANNPNIITSITTYDANDFEKKVSFSVLENSEKGLHKRFNITVEDYSKSKI
jgi:hypothetical protein